MLQAYQKSSPLAAGGVRCLSIPIHVPFTISRESLPQADIALVELQNTAGQRGLGECAPFPSLTFDTIAQASRLALGLLDEIRPCSSLEALTRLQGLREEAVKQSITAFVGVESALWDLHAREEGRSLAELWGSSRQRSISTDITLPIMEAEAVPRFWEIFSSHRFPIVKVKVSGHVERDEEMIAALKTLIPEHVELTLDGNQGYRVDEALRLVQRLEARGWRPLFFEQPLPEDDEKGLAELTARLSIPVCVDETVRTLADAQRVIQQKLAQMINVKIMKSGISESLAIMECAQKAKMPLMMGGMLESEVATGISLQMACGTGAIAFADLDTPFFFTERVTESSPWHRPEALLELPAGLGHGMVAKAKRP